MSQTAQGTGKCIILE